jgi:hypothetical protein
MLAAAIAAAAALLSPTAPARAADLMRTMEGQPDLRIFTQLARSSGADREISSHQNIMVLAPVDEAIDDRLRQQLSANPAAARRFVLDHVVATAFPFGQSLDGSLGMFRTLGGAPVELRSRGSQPGLANERSEPVAINIRADNGLLHKMDSPVTGASGVAARNLPGDPDARPQNPGGIR